MYIMRGGGISKKTTVTTVTVTLGQLKKHLND
jgi:hypothetical protein